MGYLQIAQNLLRKLKVPYTRDSIYGLLDFSYYTGIVMALGAHGRYKNERQEYIYIKSKLVLKNFIPGVYMTVLLLATIYHEFRIDILSKSHVSMGHTILAGLIIANGLNSILQIILLFLRQEAFLKAFYFLYKADKKFKQLNLHFSCRIFIFISAVLIAFLLVFFALYEVLIEYLLNEPFEVTFLQTLGYIGTYIYRLVPLYYFYSFQCLISLRLKYLNDLLKDLYEKSSREEFRRKLTVAADIYAKLCSTSECTSEALSALLLGNIVGTSFVMLLLVLSWLNAVPKSQHEINLWALTSISFTWGIIITLEYISYQSQQTGKLIATIDIPLGDEISLQQRHTILLQTLHRNITYTAAGLFEIRIGLITTHLSTMSTILMFLLHLKTYEDSSMGSKFNPL